jgi:hypothetical protein
VVVGGEGEEAGWSAVCGERHGFVASYDTLLNFFLVGF